jgi:sodium-dependent dicarboxylate transporter 2/3/5
MGSEERFDYLRRTIGLVAAPVVFVVFWALPVVGLGVQAHRLLAVLGAVVVLWMTESIPLALTALLGPALGVLLGIGSAKEIFRGFADPIVVLFLGSFLIAEAMLQHGLNRRMAFGIMRAVGTSPKRLLAAFGIATGFVSLWVFNTATTAMMFPIALAILKESRMPPAFGTALMLMTAFAASVGGLGTPVGTPPNLIGLGFIETNLKIQITFFQWMLFGLPLAIVLIAAMNALAVAQQHLGDLDRINKLVKLSVVLATTEQFAEHAAVADGASDLFVQLFGAENGHARIVSGVQSLPIGTPAVVEVIFEIK